jgi:hypothetical protein
MKGVELQQQKTSTRETGGKALDKGVASQFSARLAEGVLI